MNREVSSGRKRHLIGFGEAEEKTHSKCGPTVNGTTSQPTTVSRSYVNGIIRSVSPSNLNQTPDLPAIACSSFTLTSQERVLTVGYWRYPIVGLPTIAPESRIGVETYHSWATTGLCHGVNHFGLDDC
jgi:hypothetical protein